MSAAPAGRASLLRLYRDLLWHARRFPSKKRAGIVEDRRLTASCAVSPLRAATALAAAGMLR